VISIFVLECLFAVNSLWFIYSYRKDQDESTRVDKICHYERNKSQLSLVSKSALGWILTAGTRRVAIRDSP
jgi:hypothetical protein